MAGLTWNHATQMAEWDEDKETPTEMCDRLIEENGIRPRRGQSIATSVRRLIFSNVRNRRDIPLSVARNDLHDLVACDLESDGFKPEMSDAEKDLASYLFDRMIEDGWHTLGRDGQPGTYVEPDTMVVYDENGEAIVARVKDGRAVVEKKWLSVPWVAMFARAIWSLMVLSLWVGFCLAVAMGFYRHGFGAVVGSGFVLYVLIKFVSRVLFKRRC